MWRRRPEYAGRYWNLPVVLRCPKTGSFLECLEMKPTWVKFSKAVYFKNLANLLFKILFQFIFGKTWYLEGICLMYFYVYTKQLNKSCFDRFLKLSEPRSEREIPWEELGVKVTEESRFAPYFMNAKQKRAGKYQHEKKTWIQNRVTIVEIID